MENLLLIVDELDDALASLRSLWPQLRSLFLALILFAATVLFIMTWPLWTLGLALLVPLVRGVLGLRSIPNLRTDP